MKRPFESVKEIFFENLQRTREINQFTIEHFDKVAVWIVGFSIGGVSIIVSNLASITDRFCYRDLKTILLLLTISIISGIIYRLAFYSFQLQYKNIEIFLATSFSNKEFMDMEAGFLNTERDIKEVIRKLREEFDEDLSYLLPIYESEHANKEALLDSVKNHYRKLSAWAKKDFINAMDYAKDTFKKAFEISDKTIDRLFVKSNSAKLLKFYGWIKFISFYISIGSFIAVIVILYLTF